MRETLVIIGIVLLFYCCNGHTKKEHFPGSAGDGWMLTDSVVSVNTYTNAGLLDTTYATFYYFYKGRLIISVKSFTVREYDGRFNLTGKRDFTDEKNKRTQASGSIYQYDKKNNLTHTINTMDGKILDEDVNEYNTKSQCIKTVYISASQDKMIKYKSIDSIIAHSHDYLLTHDTTIRSFFYDNKGHLVRTINLLPNKKVKSIETNKYSGDNRLLETNEVNEKNDVVSTSFFIHTDSLVKEVRDLKELFLTDTLWEQNGKPVKIISTDLKNSIQRLSLITYDNKGNEIRSVQYKREYKPY